MAAEIISLKKLKKDGSIDSSIVQKIIQYFNKGDAVMMPIDSIYGIACVKGPIRPETLVPADNHTGQRHTVLISSFPMLERVARLDKLAFDFLHRIWPGEMIVYLQAKDGQEKIPFRMPRLKYECDLINGVGKPLIFSEIFDEKGKPVHKKKSLIAISEDEAACGLVIDEACKEHTLPTVIDITGGSMSVLFEGRVSADEIKSLYFLGADDSDI